ncbi:hypothetical protein [Pseudomonas putida]|uniref:hypothetical protein n=1 Tax=Pseudomonas putida TaxID=303 RepID=UPI0013AF6C9E|nr:hypothetical protein [Pseudomonas putida]
MPKSSVAMTRSGHILGDAGNPASKETLLQDSLLEADDPLGYTPDDDEPGLDRGPVAPVGLNGAQAELMISEFDHTDSFEVYMTDKKSNQSGNGSADHKPAQGSGKDEVKRTNTERASKAELYSRHEKDAEVDKKTKPERS